MEVPYIVEINMRGIVLFSIFKGEEKRKRGPLVGWVGSSIGLNKACANQENVPRCRTK